MSIQETSARRRSRLVAVPLVALALTAAVLVVAIQVLKPLLV